MVQIMSIWIWLLLLHFFHCGACVQPPNLGLFCARHWANTWQSLPPNAEEGDKAMQFFSLNSKLKNRGCLDVFDINFATVFGRNRSQAQLTQEPALVPGPKKASFPSTAHHTSLGGKKIKY